LAQAPSSASLHPTQADRFITGATADGWVRIYDYESGAERETHKGHHGPAHAVSYSPDGELAASGSEDGEFLRLACSRARAGQYSYDRERERERERERREREGAGEA
jgi:WD40 repeat protein